MLEKLGHLVLAEIKVYSLLWQLGIASLFAVWVLVAILCRLARPPLLSLLFVLWAGRVAYVQDFVLAIVFDVVLLRAILVNFALPTLRRLAFDGCSCFDILLGIVVVRHLFDNFASSNDFSDCCHLRLTLLFPFASLGRLDSRRFLFVVLVIIAVDLHLLRAHVLAH